MPVVQITFTYSKPPTLQEGAIYDKGGQFLQPLSFNANVAIVNLDAGDYGLLHHFYGTDKTTCAIKGVENSGSGVKPIITVASSDYSIDDSILNGQAGRLVPFTV